MLEVRETCGNARVHLRTSSFASVALEGWQNYLSALRQQADPFTFVHLEDEDGTVLGFGVDDFEEEFFGGSVHGQISSRCSSASSVIVRLSGLQFARSLEDAFPEVLGSCRASLSKETVVRSYCGRRRRRGGKTWVPR